MYNHIAGDGREYTVTDDTAVKVRAEDGRSIHDVDISMFIRNLPNGKDTVHFVTQDELEVIKKEMIQNAMTEARREVIRLLGGVIAGAKNANQEANNNITSSVPLQQDDEVISDYALKCMNYGEGED